MKPFRPSASAASFRACSNGSSGRGKGIRSITTREHELPGTSTPCHSDNVPNRQEFSSLANLSTNTPVESSPWQKISKGNRARIASVACTAARREENNPSVRPPAAVIKLASSSKNSSDRPSRPGWGRWRVEYKIPDFAGSNGVPASRLSQLPFGKPQLAAMALKLPPMVRVALANTTVLSRNSWLCSSPATDSGATLRESPRRSSRVSHTTSRCLAGSSSANTSNMRIIESCSSCRCAEREVRSAFFSGSLVASPSGAVAMANRRDVRASVSARSGGCTCSGRVVQRPSLQVPRASSSSLARSVTFTS